MVNSAIGNWQSAMFNWSLANSGVHDKSFRRALRHDSFRMKEEFLATQRVVVSFHFGAHNVFTSDQAAYEKPSAFHS